MAMMSKFGAFIRNKLEDYLPSDVPVTESEILFEEGKKRVYELHQCAEELFYADNVWEEDDKIHIYGEFAKGDFKEGQQVTFLNNYGQYLFDGEILEYLDQRPESVKVKRGFFKVNPKIYLVLSCDESVKKEDFLGQIEFLILKKEV